MRACASCAKNFSIEPDDFAFYEKLHVPAPTWCPPCRNMRRLSWREERTLYHGTCALCGKNIITIHAPGGPFTVYCRPCWNSDKWNPMDFGRDYDFGKPFFKQYRELLEAVPRPALTGSSLVNSDYSHASPNCKNCYFVFWSYSSENSQYSYGLLFSKDTFDSYTVDNSDRVYEALHGNRLYQTRFAYFSEDCLDSSFLFDCAGLSDCFGCVNLRKKKHCLFNKQLSKEQYVKELATWDLGSYTRLQEAKEKFRALYLSMPHRFAHVINGSNVTGDIIRDTKDCKTCFSTLDGVQNCKYLYFAGLNLKDSYDVSLSGDLCELMYETVASGRMSRAFFGAGGEYSKNIEYTDWASNSSDLFGCVALKHKRYCIFNKQYNKEEYETLVAQIKKHMDEMPYVDARGRQYGYGEFFPAELSAYAYNESQAFTWYPKTKEEVLREGLRWQDPPARDYKVTKKPEELPDHIKDVDDSILGETIGCMHAAPPASGCNEQCAGAFRLTPVELSFYRTMHLALPRLCPNCRHGGRLKWRNGYQMWHRRCMCGKQTAYANTTKHSHDNPPTGGSCSNEFETTFSPEKPEIVYCKECYQSELL